ncbi:MAG: hypothetical protein ACE5IL_06585 [Myxococcota bacterium]
MRAARCGLGAALLLLAACATVRPPPYHHNRYDYGAFRARFGSLPEPNYLPWLTHLERLPDGTRAFVLCRWPNGAFPLHYRIVTPQIPEAVQNEFSPRSPKEYVAAVRRAFARWEVAIGRPVRFVATDDATTADLTVRFDVTLQPAAEGLYGGRAGAGGDLCVVTGAGATPDVVAIRFAVHDIHLSLVDSMGLLTPGQVQLLALHEIGHVLGASGQHSPLRGDLMFPVADDSRIEPISEHDANSFRALYRLPPGAIYSRPDEPHVEPMAEARRGPPRLGPELRDPRLRAQVQFPRGWQVIHTKRGWIAVDGLSWDYDASIQVVLVRGTPEEILARYGQAYLGSGEVIARDVLEVDGRVIPRWVVRRGPMTEIDSVLAWGPRSTLLVIADAEAHDFELYRPWFKSVLLSIEPLAEP